jgi:hypothetical protein
LLRQVVKFGLAKSVLDAEATLFANGPKLASEWVAERKARWALRGTKPKIDMRKRKVAAKRKSD